MFKLLTIVVPVFKVESYIDKCLDSLILEDEEMMNRLEVIIVNDGTPDRSAEMSREYVKRYPGTFLQIDKENGGHGSAWNVGLREAKGRYLRFLDSDDWLSNLDRLMKDLADCDADMVFTRYNKCYADGRIETSNLALPVNEGQSAPVDAAKWGNPGNDFNFWTITYKTSILQPLQPLFAERVMYDDYILTWTPLVYGRTYTAFNYVLYNYLIGRPGQSMSLAAQAKRAAYYWTCFNQFEQVRSRLDETKIPSDHLKTIDSSIEGYAALIFWYQVFMPYNDAKRKMSYLKKVYLQGNNKTSVLRRYGKQPFVFFIIFEYLRYWLQNKCHRRSY